MAGKQNQSPLEGIPISQSFQREPIFVSVNEVVPMQWNM